MHPKRTMRPGRVPRVCVVCSTPFAVKPSTLARGKNVGLFCKRACRTVMQSEMSRRPLADRFREKVVKTGCCWLWMGHRQSSGHGSLGVGGKNGKVIKAHRASWEIHNGAIPDSLHVLHNCPGGDQPSCVNPAHLWLGTHQQNMEDFWRKMRAGPLQRCCHEVAA